MPRIFLAGLALMLPLVCPGADDSRPHCGPQNQGQLWPDAANHDSKALSRLMRCGELFICVRGTWHYHWEAPSIRVDQLARHGKSKAAKPAVCEVESARDAARSPANAAASSFR